MHGNKESGAIFKVLIVLLPNQHHCTHDLIMIKMIPQDLLYNKSTSIKTWSKLRGLALFVACCSKGIYQQKSHDDFY